MDWRWRVSKSSCSSLGRRGGEGPVWENGLLGVEWCGEVVSVRRLAVKRWARGARGRRRVITGEMGGMAGR